MLKESEVVNRSNQSLIKLVANTVIQKIIVIGNKSSSGEVRLKKFIIGFINSWLKTRSGDTSTAKKGSTAPKEKSSAKEEKNIKNNINISWLRRFLLIWAQKRISKCINDLKLLEYFIKKKLYFKIYENG